MRAGRAADWSKGRSGGPIRNSIMAAQKPDECIAFPRANGEWGSGTLDMIGKAAKAGARVDRVFRPAESGLGDRQGSEANTAEDRSVHDDPQKGPRRLKAEESYGLQTICLALAGLAP